jgi:cholesterol oxidase
MGASSTDGSVVSKRDLAVWGSPGLHVIDGSVIPSNTLRNPSNTILAIAEKAMDVILGTGDPGW